MNRNREIQHQIMTVLINNNLQINHQTSLTINVTIYMHNKGRKSTEKQ